MVEVDLHGRLTELQGKRGSWKHRELRSAFDYALHGCTIALSSSSQEFSVELNFSRNRTTLTNMQSFSITNGIHESSRSEFVKYLAV